MIVVTVSILVNRRVNIRGSEMEGSIVATGKNNDKQFVQERERTDVGPLPMVLGGLRSSAESSRISFFKEISYREWKLEQSGDHFSIRGCVDRGT